MNRKSRLISLLIVFCLSATIVQAQTILNLNFESPSYDRFIPKWYLTGANDGIYLDSLTKHECRFSIKIDNPVNSDVPVNIFGNMLPVDQFAGTRLEIQGWVKTEDIDSGYAGLWVRVDGEMPGDLGYDDMRGRGLKGNNDWVQLSLTMDISDEAKSLTIGGLLIGQGSAWFDNLELYVDGVKYTDAEVKTTLSPNELEALRKYIYPLRTCEPDDGDVEDLRILGSLINGSKVVALGETTHGTSEIFKLKNRIIQYLAANEGFDVFSIEANMPESYKINDYTLNSKGDPKELIKGMHFWTWQTEEVLEMVKWMQKFNTQGSRIQFTGFDMQYVDEPLKELLAVFEKDEEINTEIVRLQTMISDPEIIQRTPLGLIQINDSYKEELELLLSAIQKRIETTFLKEEEKVWLLQNTVVIKQFLENNNLKWRDICMADNFMWIFNNNPDSRFVIWAHNNHIFHKGTLIPPVGEYLTQYIPDDYTTFGFTFFEGSFISYGENGLTSYKAAEAYPGSLEYLLNQLNEDMFILDLKKIKSDKNSYTEWLSNYLDYRSIGATTAGGQFLTARKILDDFDYLIFIKTTSPSHLFN